MKVQHITLISTTLLFAAISQKASAWGQGHAVGGHQNAAGGYSAGSVRGFRGPGAGRASGWAMNSEGQGNAVVSSGRAFRGPNGSQGGRAGYTTRQAGGGVTHQGGATWQGANGQGISQSNFSSDGQGNAQGSVNTQYTTNNGGSYQGNTTGSVSNGSVNISHTGTCYDANGNAVACPSR